MYLYRLHDFYEDKKWVEITSKFFDQTGKQLDPRVLKESLGVTKWA